jgi:CheY-like chemotaxis protein
MTKPPKVLVIEDNPLDQILIRAIFEQEGFEVSSAHDGEAAISMINSELDLVVLDVLLPSLNGFEVMLWVQENNPDLLDRIVIVTNLPVEMLTHALEGMLIVEKSSLVETLTSIARNWKTAAAQHGL